MSVFLNMVHALLRLHKMILILLLSSKSTFLYLKLLSQLEPVNISPLSGGAMLDAVRRGCWWDTERHSREMFFFLVPVYFFLLLWLPVVCRTPSGPHCPASFLGTPGKQLHVDKL